MTQEYWKLTIVLQSDCLYVLGEEEELREVLRVYQSGEAFGKLCISGICDSVDRAPLTLVVDYDSVIALTLVRLY